jgi:hypothetical protein
MGEDTHDNDFEFSPTYKTLFLGACIVIGSAFGWWFTNFISSVELRFATIEQRLVELETRSLRGAWEADSINRDLVEIRRKMGQ